MDKISSPKQQRNGMEAKGGHFLSFVDFRGQPSSLIGIYWCTLVDLLKPLFMFSSYRCTTFHILLVFVNKDYYQSKTPKKKQREREEGIITLSKPSFFITPKTVSSVTCNAIRFGQRLCGTLYRLKCGTKRQLYTSVYS